MSDRSGWRAVLIGVAKYDDEAFHDVPAALNSVRAFKGILTDPNLCGWPEESVTVVENPRKPIDIGRPLQEAALAATGTLLVYFVGHGELNESNELCLVVGDTEIDHVEITGLDYDNIRLILSKSKAGAKIVILDCCNSGKAIEALSGAESQIANTTVIKGAYTLTAADYAAHVPSPQLAETQTSFTKALVDIIREGVPEGGEFLDLSTIYGSLIQRLSAEALPKPNQRGTDTVESFEFTRNMAFSSHAHARSVAQQVPDDPIELEMLHAIRSRVEGRGVEFSAFAIALWKLIAPSTGECALFRAWGDASVSISGNYLLGPIGDRVRIDFVLDAHCRPIASGVDYREMDRLIYRMESAGQFGVMLTLSYVDPEVYERIRVSREPVVVVCGKDIVDILTSYGYDDAVGVEEWLNGKLSLGR
ncbi:caspase family protein [Nocardia tengchongensis]|uniref:Caspase family protein n=1 Tax=Nocardia tengchongensis TaxID=2055889 RepID=A0ABX8CMD1_9NOCA|nr:caspase family protein [Nocardia tengchongensis]QVI21050.1 caspase family protein [Nocardia tengchongensis]